ncbi:hypothetical protein GEMRC1_002676 [Eukaryota sp. GEM-RC1]
MSIIFALEVVGALLIILSIGFLLGYFRILKTKSLISLNFYVNTIALPAIVFVTLAPFTVRTDAIPIFLAVSSAVLVIIIFLFILRFFISITDRTFATLLLSGLFGSNAVVGRPVVSALFPDNQRFANEFVFFTLFPLIILVIPVTIFLFELSQLDQTEPEPQPPPVESVQTSPGVPKTVIHRSSQTISLPGTPTHPHKEHIIVEVDEVLTSAETDIDESPTHIHPTEPRLSKKDAAKKAGLKTITSPLLIAGIIGFFPWALLGIGLPTVLFVVFNSLGLTATPVGLLVVGLALGLFHWREKKINWWLVSVYAFIKLIIFPLLTLPFAVLYGLRPDEARVVLFYTASPSSTAAYTLSRFYSTPLEDTSKDVAPSLALQMLLVFPVVWVYIILLDAFQWFE